MSYIFDAFPTRRSAVLFAEEVAEKEGRHVAVVFDSKEAADVHDPFPYHLTPPIVHVDRDVKLSEMALVDLAHSAGGVFAGT